MKNIFRKIKNAISCKMGLHDWQKIKSISLSNIIFLIKKHNPELRQLNYSPGSDYIVYDKECTRCKKQDLNIDETKNVLTEHILYLLSQKK